MNLILYQLVQSRSNYKQIKSLHSYRVRDITGFAYSFVVFVSANLFYSITFSFSISLIFIEIGYCCIVYFQMKISLPKKYLQNQRTPLLTRLDFNKYYNDFRPQFYFHYHAIVIRFASSKIYHVFID